MRRKSMKIKILLLIVVCIVIISFYFIYQNRSIDERTDDTYIYVSPDGSDQNDGTISSPFRTLKQAALKATAGTTVFVREGTYYESLYVEHSGTKSKPINFKNYQDEKVIISGKHLKEPKEDTALIEIHNKDYITIQGFTVEELTTSHEDATVMGINVSGTSSHIILKQNHVHSIATHADDGNAHGIAVYGTGKMEDIQVLDNTVENLTLGASEALVLNGNINGFLIANNIVRQNNNIGIDLIGYEGTASDNDFVRNGIVENNEVYNNSSYGNPAYGDEYTAGGIYVDGGSNITIRQNKVYGNDIGIEATSEHYGKNASEIHITDNEVYDNAFTGISIGGYDEKRGGTIGSIISENIIYGNDTKGLEGGQLLLQYYVTDNRIEKNKVSASSSQIFLVNIHEKNSGNTLSHNTYLNETGEEGLWIWKDEEFNSFSSYQRSTNNDLDSKYINDK